jgi:hypothetical protein
LLSNFTNENFESRARRCGGGGGLRVRRASAPRARRVRWDPLPLPSRAACALSFSIEKKFVTQKTMISLGQFANGVLTRLERYLWIGVAVHALKWALESSLFHLEFQHCLLE